MADSGKPSGAGEKKKTRSKGKREHDSEKIQVTIHVKLEGS